MEGGSGNSIQRVDGVSRWSLGRSLAMVSSPIWAGALAISVIVPSANGHAVKRASSRSKQQNSPILWRRVDRLPCIAACLRVSMLFESASNPTHEPARRITRRCDCGWAEPYAFVGGLPCPMSSRLSADGDRGFVFTPRHAPSSKDPFPLGLGRTGAEFLSGNCPKSSRNPIVSRHILSRNFSFATRLRARRSCNIEVRWRVSWRSQARGVQKRCRKPERSIEAYKQFSIQSAAAIPLCQAPWAVEKSSWEHASPAKQSRSLTGRASTAR